MNRIHIAILIIAVGILTAALNTGQEKITVTKDLDIDITAYDSPTNATLYRIHHSDGKAATVSGDGDLLHWNGTAWRIIGSRETEQWAARITNDTAWYGGFAPDIITRWDGTVQDQDLDQQYPGMNIYAFTETANTLWAAGGKFSESYSGSEGQGILVRRTANGWEDTNDLPANTDVFFMDLTPTNNGTIYAIGGGEETKPTQLVRWTGEGWEPTIEPRQNQSYHALVPGHDGGVWAVGDTIFQASQEGITTEFSPPELLNGATQVCDGYLAVGHGSTVLYWEEDTARYADITDELTHQNSLYGVDAIDRNTVWITGDNGIILQGDLNCDA